VAACEVLWLRASTDFTGNPTNQDLAKPEAFLRIELGLHQRAPNSSRLALGCTLKREEVNDELLRFTAAYRDVYDGGYAEVRGIREWAKMLDAESRQFLWDRLLESVAKQESNVWGVAVAVLAQERPQGIAEKLDDLLTGQNASDEWRDEIVFSLLCLGYRPAAAKYFGHIKNALQNGREGALRLLAASCKVDTNECLALSSDYFGRVLRREQSHEEYRSVVPVFVRHFMDADQRLLSELVARTKSVNLDAAKRLAALFLEYLMKPWNVREFGEARVSGLKDEILQIAPD
jgi:hypothetical protein